jgi:hypothetical protein
MTGPDNHAIITRAVRNGREFGTHADGTSWTRRLDRTTNEPITDWTLVEPLPANDTTSSSSTTPQKTRRHLSVVAEHQTTNEAKHWSLFSHALPPNHPTDTAPGQVWQVKGDAEFMHHDHASDIDQLNSPGFAWHQVLCDDLTEEQFQRVDEIAQEEQPPRAVNRAAVREHCQGWVLRVVRRLVREGVIKMKEGVMEGLEGVMDPIAR